MGMRIHPLTGKRSYHYGQDIATQYGNKVIAPAEGVVHLGAALTKTSDKVGRLVRSNAARNAKNDIHQTGLFDMNQVELILYSSAIATEIGNPDQIDSL